MASAAIEEPLRSARATAQDERGFSSPRAAPAGLSRAAEPLCPEHRAAPHAPRPARADSARLPPHQTGQQPRLISVRCGQKRPEPLENGEAFSPVPGAEKPCEHQSGRLCSSSLRWDRRAGAAEPGPPSRPWHQRSAEHHTARPQLMLILEKSWCLSRQNCSMLQLPPGLHSKPRPACPQPHLADGSRQLGRSGFDIRQG